MIQNRLDVDALDDLLGILGRLKASDDPVNTVPLWIPDIDTPEKIPSRHANPRLKKLCTSLRRMKVLRDALRALVESAEDFVDVLQTECNLLSLQVGIHSLPDEILSRIFELGKSLDPGNADFCINVSHVCRRFRSVALSTARLWSHLSTLQTRSEIQACLSRAKAANLTIHLMFEFCGSRHDPHSRTPTLQEFLESVVSHKHRWIEFIHTTKDRSRGQDAVVLSPYAHLELPSLQSLRFENNFFDGGASNDAHIFDGWTMPSLTHFAGVNVMPTPVIGTSLTSCELELSHGPGGPGSRYWDLHSLIAFFQEASHLNILVLGFDHMESRTTSTYYPTTLPALESLTVNLSRRNSYVLMEQFFEALHFPQILEMSVTLNNSTSIQFPTARINSTVVDFNPMDLILKLLPLKQPRPALQHFSLTIPEAKASGIDSLLLRLPSIQHLTIKGPHILQGSRVRVALPPLQTLSLTQCHEFSTEFVRGLAESLKRGREWKNFRKLEVIACRGLPENFLRRLKRKMEGKMDYTMDYEL